MTEANFSFTTKVEGDLFTIRGNTIDEFTINAVAVAAVPAVGRLLSIIDGTVSPTNDSQAVNNVVAGLGAAPIAPVAPVDPFGGSFNVPAPAPAAAGDRTCAHGVMVKRTGMGAKGEWKAWFCPTPKDTPGQCKAIFADRKNPYEWNAF